MFTSGSASFDFSILGCNDVSCGSDELIISGTGVTNNGSVLQTFEAVNGGQLIFNNTSSAASAQCPFITRGGNPVYPANGYTIFNDSSSAAGATISNSGDGGIAGGSGPGETIFNGASTAGHATITNDGAGLPFASGGRTTFKPLDIILNSRHGCRYSTILRKN